MSTRHTFHPGVSCYNPKWVQKKKDKSLGVCHPHSGLRLVCINLEIPFAGRIKNRFLLGEKPTTMFRIKGHCLHLGYSTV